MGRHEHGPAAPSAAADAAAAAAAYRRCLGRRRREDQSERLVDARLEVRLALAAQQSAVRHSAEGCGQPAVVEPATLEAAVVDLVKRGELRPPPEFLLAPVALPLVDQGQRLIRALEGG